MKTFQCWIINCNCRCLAVQTHVVSLTRHLIFAMKMKYLSFLILFRYTYMNSLTSLIINIISIILNSCCYSYPITSAAARTNRAFRRPATLCPARCGRPTNGARWECTRFYASKTRRYTGGDRAPRSYHLRAKTLSLLATITDLGALAGSSRKHPNTYASIHPRVHTYSQHARTYREQSTAQLAISTTSFTAKRTAQMETGLMVVHDLHAPFTLA